VLHDRVAAVADRREVQRLVDREDVVEVRVQTTDLLRVELDSELACAVPERRRAQRFSDTSFAWRKRPR
jgi:hypothetical protein